MVTVWCNDFLLSVSVVDDEQAKSDHSSSSMDSFQVGHTCPETVLTLECERNSNLTEHRNHHTTAEFEGDFFVYSWSVARLLTVILKSGPLGSLFWPRTAQ